jgi:hypothetical protein
MFSNDWRQAARSLTLVPALLCLATEGRAQERISQATAVRVPELEAQFDKVYTREGPLGTVSRRLYIPYPRSNVSSVMTTDYAGHEGLRRFEVLTYQVFDDVYQDAQRRYSEDNGKTWTAWERDPEVDIVCAGDCSHQRFVPTGPSRGCYDPESGLTVQPYSLATFAGDPRKTGLRGTNYHTFIRTSADNGRSWTEAGMIRYQDGPDYDPAKLRDPAFLNTNYAVFYYNIIPAPGGGVMFPADTTGGARVFAGRWDKGTARYHWTAGALVSILPKLSGYVAEPWLAVLGDGRILLDLRGTNAGTEPRAPGRHWYSLSRDGGKTWTEPVDWRYDDGAQFFSPATMAKILRHSRTGKLYWFGNISPGQTSGNSPRYPFYIAEIDETGPALKRATLTVIDDYDSARHTAAVQFSNFYVFENRETQEFEIYLSPYGQYGNMYQASVYKYAIRLK